MECGDEIAALGGRGAAGDAVERELCCLNSGESQRVVGEFFGYRGHGLYAVRFASDLLATPRPQYYCFTKLRQSTPQHGFRGGAHINLH